MNGQRRSSPIPKLGKGSFNMRAIKKSLYKSSDSGGDESLDRVNVRSNNSQESPTRRQSAASMQVLQCMQSAAEAAHKRRFRITICTTVAALVPFVYSIVMFWLQSLFIASPFHFGHAGWYGGVVPWFGMIMLLGVMPNDAALIRVLNLMLIFFAISAFFICVGLITALLEINPVYWKENESDPTYAICEGTAYQAGCISLVARYGICGSLLALAGILCSANLQRHSGITFYDPSQKKGFRYNDSAFKIPARSALNRVWFLLRFSAFLPTGFFYLVYAVVMVLLGEMAPWYPDAEFYADVFMGVSWMIAALVFTDERRRVIMGYLSRMNTQGEADSAAAVAALLGGRDAQTSLKLAQSRFRAIKLSDLTEADFQCSDDDSKNSLFAKSTEVSLGGCDAFISHSWSDCGSSRYDALQMWAEQFKQANGREPTLWLDKACIDQSDISANLLCLPVFTAGCERLLILAGKTYTERLWCIIEVFVFIRMGGALARITVLPIDMADESEAQKMFETVDAKECKCFLESDRQRLLGVVEQGFGNFHQFNDILRHVFKKRMSGIVRSRQFKNVPRVSEERLSTEST
eukprot:gene595-1014_t